MNRQQKESVVRELQSRFSQSQGDFCCWRIKGLTVAQMQNLEKICVKKVVNLKLLKLVL